MEKKTVLVVSRHPELADVRKHVLEQAGFEVVSVSEPEALEEAFRNRKKRSGELRLTPSSFANAPFLNCGTASRRGYELITVSSITTRLRRKISWTG
jgi:CheY-like chemotaxis protein